MTEARQIRDESCEATTWAFADLPRHAFSVIVADPPWSFKTWSETNQTRKASSHYDVIPLQQIRALPVAELAADHAVLLLWASNPMLPHALEVMEGWGFTYKTVGFGWAKTTRKSDPALSPVWHMGLGYWSRSNLEMCLLGTRGKPARVDKGVRQLIIAPRREHSRKPDEFYAAVERLLPGPYCDLFSRQRRPGWSHWGNEVDRFDEQAAILRPRRDAGQLQIHFEAAEAVDRLAQMEGQMAPARSLPVGARGADGAREPDHEVRVLGAIAGRERLAG